MNPLWLILIVPIVLICGMWVKTILIERHEKKLTIQQIDELTEEIIQEAIDHAEVVDSRSFSEYDINVSDEGEEKIRKILEGVL